MVQRHHLRIDRGAYDSGTAWGCFSNAENIARLEARALLYGIREAPPAHSLKLCIDNQALLGALKKGRSQEFFLNKLILQIIELLRERCNTWEVIWIPSEHNFADSLSRKCLAHI